MLPLEPDLREEAVVTVEAAIRNKSAAAVYGNSNVTNCL